MRGQPPPPPPPMRLQKIPQPPPMQYKMQPPFPPMRPRMPPPMNPGFGMQPPQMPQMFLKPPSMPKMTPRAPPRPGNSKKMSITPQGRSLLDSLMIQQQQEHQQRHKQKLESIIAGRSVFEERVSTDYEEDQSKLLDYILENEVNTYMNREQVEYRESVLIKLRDVLDMWMKRVKKKHGYPEDMSENGSCKLLPYGSYKLGVSSTSGDIDSLIIAPSYVDRNEDFFGVLYPLLQELSSKNKSIEDVTAVNQENTIMPLIKMNFYEIQIDLVFANVHNVDEIEDVIKLGNSENEEIMQNMDDKMKRSYNGYRNAEMIIQSLHREEDPPEINIRREAVFRTTLKCVKLWSKKNGLDSNKTGYLGGIAWAILTAKICQLFPYESPAKLLERFFWLYGKEWNWDEWFIRIENPKDDESGRTRQRFMHVMTPSWPQMNSTYNASFSTRETLTDKMKEAHQMVSTILIKYSNVPNIMQVEECKAAWIGFFRRFDFFSSYDHFLELNILGDDDHLEYLRWSGFIEAKFRILGEKMEELLKLFDLKIHTWPEEFDRVPNSIEGYQHIISMYIGFRLHQNYEDPIDLNYPVVRFVEYIEHEWAKSNISRNKKKFNLQFCYKKRNDIPKEVLEGVTKKAKSNASSNGEFDEDDGAEIAENELEDQMIKKSLSKDGGSAKEVIENMKKSINSLQMVKSMSEKKEKNSKNIRIDGGNRISNENSSIKKFEILGKREMEQEDLDNELDNVQKKLKMTDDEGLDDFAKDFEE